MGCFMACAYNVLSLWSRYAYLLYFVCVVVVMRSVARFICDAVAIALPAAPQTPPNKIRRSRLAVKSPFWGDLSPLHGKHVGSPKTPNYRMQSLAV